MIVIYSFRYTDLDVSLTKTVKLLCKSDEKYVAKVRIIHMFMHNITVVHGFVHTYIHI